MNKDLDYLILQSFTNLLKLMRFKVIYIFVLFQKLVTLNVRLCGSRIIYTLGCLQSMCLALFEIKLRLSQLFICGRYILAIITFISIPLNSFAKTISTDSITSEVSKDLLEIVDDKTLVLVTINDTILKPQSRMFNFNSLQRNFIDDMITAAENKIIFYKPINTWYQEHKSVLLEEEWPYFIKAMQDKGAFICGISQERAKIYDIVSNYQELLLSTLKNANINFSASLKRSKDIKVANLKEIDARDLPKKYDNTTNKKLESQKIQKHTQEPKQAEQINDASLQINKIDKQSSVFNQGVLFNGLFSPAQTVKDFLRVTDIIPEKIVIISNDIDLINQIKSALGNYQADFYALNYLKFKNIKQDLDYKIMQLQQETLLNQNKWLEDDEAKVMATKDEAADSREK